MREDSTGSISPRVLRRRLVSLGAATGASIGVDDDDALIVRAVVIRFVGDVSSVSIFTRELLRRRVPSLLDDSTSASVAFVTSGERFLVLRPRLPLVSIAVVVGVDDRRGIRRRIAGLHREGESGTGRFGLFEDLSSSSSFVRLAAGDALD